jgi:acetyl-CoA carboxylase beta subunit
VTYSKDETFAYQDRAPHAFAPEGLDRAVLRRGARRAELERSSQVCPGSATTKGASERATGRALLDPGLRVELAVSASLPEDPSKFRDSKRCCLKSPQKQPGRSDGAGS